MKILILGAEDGFYVKQLVETAQRRHWEVKVQPFAELSHQLLEDQVELYSEDGSRVRDYDAVLVRTMPASSLEKVIFRMDALYGLEQQGMKILNPVKGLECAIDKWLTLTRLRERGISVPKTIVCETAEQGMQAFLILGMNVVVKPVFGAEGRGMIKVDHPEIAWRVFKTLEQMQAVIYVQEFLRHPGYDLRVLIFGDSVIGAIKRFSKDDFRTNTAQHGEAMLHQLTDEEAEIAVAAVRTTGTVFAGVDLVYDQEGKLYVLEVNGVPGWKGFQQATGIDVSKVCLDQLEQWMKQG